MDPRLVDHGKRVAYLVSRMLDIDGTFTEKEKQDICFLALLHDVGAYKTEEINEMAKFETQDIWEHSIYGYLFLYHFSPLKDWAQAIPLSSRFGDKPERCGREKLPQFLRL